VNRYGILHQSGVGGGDKTPAAYVLDKRIEGAAEADNEFNDLYKVRQAISSDTRFHREIVYHVDL
jgi:hypothetical protein